MNKKAFTLVELLAVIVILAVLIILVAPSLLNSAKASRQKSFDTKVDIIETAAIMYGQDNYRNIVNGASKNEAGYAKEVIDSVVYNTYTLEIRSLVPEYVAKDFDDGVLMNGKMYYVQDPRDNTRYLDDYTITIRINTNTRKVTAEFNES